MRVEHLNKALGRPAQGYVQLDNGQLIKQLGHFSLDHQLGGYRIEEDGNPVFGHQRMNKRELCNMLDAILVAIKFARGETHGSYWCAIPPEASKP